MNEKDRKDLQEACRSNDGKISSRAHAVYMVLVRNKSITDTAEDLSYTDDWVSKWVKRFEEGGVAALPDRPRKGRPRKVKLSDIYHIILDNISELLKPISLREKIRDATGVLYHVTHVTKLMHKFGLSRKTATGIHINRASPKEVRKWQKETNQGISCLKRAGYRIFAQDETHCSRDSWKGRAGWTPVGEPLLVPYTGDYEAVSVMGSISTCGRQMFRCVDRATTENFVGYLQEMHRLHGRIAVIMDRSPIHISKMVDAFLEENPGVRRILLPKGSPYLNGMEEAWHQIKPAVLVGKFYPTKDALRRALSERLRTFRFNLDIVGFLNRSPIMPTNF